MAHIVSAFDEDLVQVQARISEMGGLCEELLSKALESVQGRDPGLARAVIERDKALDAMEMALEDQVVKVIALRQPVAAELPPGVVPERSLLGHLPQRSQAAFCTGRQSVRHRCRAWRRETATRSRRDRNAELRVLRYLRGGAGHRQFLLTRR